MPWIYIWNHKGWNVDDTFDLRSEIFTKWQITEETEIGMSIK